MIHLSKRLQAILSWVHGSCVADIGCDHAYLACAAILEGKAKKAYACDIAEGPLAHAKTTISQYNLENEVSCLLMNGISKLPHEVDCVVIAGMGSQTVIDILTQGKEYIQPTTRFVVSVHKDIEMLRKYLSDHHFYIEKERIVQDGQHFYPILSFISNGQSQILTEQELYYGKNVIQDEDYFAYINTEIQKWDRIIENIQNEKKYMIEHRLDICKTIKNTHS